MPIPLAKFTVFVALLIALTGCTRTVRFATYNASLNREKQGQLVADLSTPDNEQAKKVAEIIQRAKPDVLLINEFDYDEANRAATLFRANYLERSQNGQPAIVFPYVYVAPSNTGVPSSIDLNRDGKTIVEPGTRGYGEDSLGFGQFPGQYAFVLFSKYPIQLDRIRTHQKLLWSELPGNRMPLDFYGPRAAEVLTLPSKNHVDVPIDINGKVVHVLAAHPTPPVFDGPEDRNGLRNHDEIKLLAMMIDKLTGVADAPDKGFPVTEAPAVRDVPFVVMGDMNADPNDGESVDHAIRQLLDHPRVDASVVPRSNGAVEAAKEQAGPNAEHKTDAATDTADFSEKGSNSGNLRVDYVLPSRGLTPIAGGVFWPASNEPGHELIDASDHRLVWMDVRVK
jgi:3-phytase